MWRGCHGYRGGGEREGAPGLHLLALSANSFHSSATIVAACTHLSYALKIICHLDFGCLIRKHPLWTSERKLLEFSLELAGVRIFAEFLVISRICGIKCEDMNVVDNTALFGYRVDVILDISQKSPLIIFQHALVFLFEKMSRYLLAPGRKTNFNSFLRSVFKLEKSWKFRTLCCSLVYGALSHL